MSLVKVYNAKDGLEANIIADVLKNSEIPCHIQDSGSGEYLNIYYGFSVYGKDIYVDEIHLANAKAIINDFNSDFDDEYKQDDAETSTSIPWYYKKNALIRGMFLLPVILAAIFVILGFIEGI